MKCPNCNGNLNFRKSNRKIKFHQRSGITSKDIYLCGNVLCSFQIGVSKFQLMTLNLERKYRDKVVWDCLVVKQTKC